MKKKRTKGNFSAFLQLLFLSFCYRRNEITSDGYSVKKNFTKFVGYHILYKKLHSNYIDDILLKAKTEITTFRMIFDLCCTKISISIASL